MTAEEWATIRYFKPGEVACTHCGEERMDLTFMQRLDDARNQFGRAIMITSGYRCRVHNEAIGGSPTSSHLTGRAVDIDDRKDPVRRGLLIEACRLAGLAQFEVSRDGHLHVMADASKPTPFMGIEP